MNSQANLIGGEWSAGTPTPNVNPSDLSDVVGHYDHASEGQVRCALAAARDAFRSWSTSSVGTRAELLERVAREISARQEELADLLAREEGKALADARKEVVRASQIFSFFAAEVYRIRGEKLPSLRPDVGVEITREPIGVVALVTPWNFPLAIPAWKIAPALAYGNTVVFKPAESTPASAWVLAEIIHRAGAPAGVFNLVMGRGDVLSDALCGPGIAAISFTGSARVGHDILFKASAHGARVQLEMGGKNAFVVLNDARLDLAVRCALDGAFFSTGQRCTASSRLIVEEGIHDAFLEALIAAMGRERVGDARDPSTTIGPVASERQLEIDLDYIAVAQGEGATLVKGGERLARDTDGYFLSPALFADSESGMRINQEEVFGPVASIIKAADFEDALAIANDVPFGLCAGIATNSLRHATEFQRRAEAGMVMVNLATAGVDHHVPFGGRKQSSYGPREQGTYAAEFYTAVKTAYVNADPEKADAAR